MSTNLSKEASELVREGQAALHPMTGDKQRIFQALQARIQNETSSESEPTSIPREAPSNTGTAPSGGERLATNDVATAGSSKLAALGKYTLIAGGLLAAFVGLSNLTSNDEPTAKSVMVPADLAPVSSAQVPSIVSAAPSAETSPEVTTPAVVTPERPSVARSPAADNLAAEAALLSQAEKALHAGDLNRALTLTSEHRKKFPKGLMARERVNIRVQSLCGLGRDKDADSEYARSRGLSKVKPGEACLR